jgi:hypothetical protein
VLPKGAHPKSHSESRRFSGGAKNLIRVADSSVASLLQNDVLLLFGTTTRGSSPSTSSPLNLSAFLPIFFLMSSLLSLRSLCISFAFLITGIGICQAALGIGLREDKEKLVVLPFAIEGLDSSQNRMLQQHFEQRLRESINFEVLPERLFRNALAQAGISRIDACVSLPCLAQLGNVLNVQKVVHVQGLHAGQRYIMQIRLVNVSDAKLLYDEPITYSGEFNMLLAEAISEHARNIDKTYVASGTPWYYYAAGVLVGVGIIYWLFTTWASSGSSETSNSPSTPTVQ